ncbi:MULTISPECIES: DUF397 domain-containing protein [unclassified Streptomyces]|uniref:DUF397 domain-containing protein n=1 Tax=unclassified Streptomyces TaxID=2593676 RepID=UPI002DD9ECE6|nr:DUF397 domain-containing protein [Streptomyces sp. NBC_01788]WSB26108.1 DUF397 domain-containing protein [Streptomyces sp. NBC_01788]
MNPRQDTGDRGQLVWRKSSYSGSGGGNCVEVAETVGQVVVRDSKNMRGAKVHVSREAWGAFLPYSGGCAVC